MSAKRTLDVLLAGMALLVVSPVLAIVAIGIRLGGGPGPILFRAQRVGIHRRPFTMFKFRTMRIGNAPTASVITAQGDPRIFPLGRLMRSAKLDELPQLFNILRGEMSIVGPRPERPLFVAQFKDRIPQYMLRHKVKAGITGWAQVNGWRGNTSIEKRIEFDLYYIENWSLLLDVKILILTLFRGFGQKHAY